MRPVLNSYEAKGDESRYRCDYPEHHLPALPSHHVDGNEPQYLLRQVQQELSAKQAFGSRSFDIRRGVVGLRTGLLRVQPGT
jgi:hypothetical protein